LAINYEPVSKSSNLSLFVGTKVNEILRCESVCFEPYQKLHTPPPASHSTLCIDKVPDVTP